MARSTQSKNIDGHEVTVQQLPTMRAMRLLVRIAGYVGPAIGEVSKGGLGNSDVGAIGAAVGRLAKDMGPDDFEALTRELLEGSFVTVDGKKQELLKVVDVVFRGNVFAMFKCVAFALEVNYGNFTDALQGALGVQAKAQE